MESMAIQPQTKADVSSNIVASHEPMVYEFYEPVTGTMQYIVADPVSKKAVMIDSVLDFDPIKNHVSTESADELLAAINDKGYSVERLLETHVHADHLTASRYLQKRLLSTQSTVPPICIGAGISKVQATMGPRYAVPSDRLADAFDEIFDAGHVFSIGSLEAKVLSLPGHTPDHIGYMIGSNVFVGDSIFNPDLGSARADFPGGSATALWSSMKALLALPSHYKLYTGHDYPAADPHAVTGKKDSRSYATVEEHNLSNKHAKIGVQEHEFVKLRTERDGALGSPRLLHQALTVNVAGGRFPTSQDGLTSLLDTPITFSGGYLTC
ncbi:hypothetical protein QM012_007558 [Aureobasidium pullulans]|uniref:Metallo-beta-lactamase domain-containing protein n=1 Tax=Aureobasidium pullulans TaxID=5580 RepID=A0ABR0TPV4_AURPU